MKSIKTMLLTTVAVAGFGLLLGTSDAEAASVHTVQAGDTLSGISTQYAGNNSLIDAIAQANGIADANMIYAGEQLTIPGVNEVVSAAPVQQAAPAQEAPVQETYVEQAPVEQTQPAVSSSSAKEWIAQKESSGSYSATNGRYIGRYQLDSSYLNGDYSEANQERVAEQYVAERYGSWENAQAFWQQNGWY